MNIQTNQHQIYQSQGQLQDAGWSPGMLRRPGMPTWNFTSFTSHWNTWSIPIHTNFRWIFPSEPPAGSPFLIFFSSLSSPNTRRFPGTPGSGSLEYWRFNESGSTPQQLCLWEKHQLYRSYSRKIGNLFEPPGWALIVEVCSQFLGWKKSLKAPPSQAWTPWNNRVRIHQDVADSTFPSQKSIGQH